MLEHVKKTIFTQKFFLPPYTPLSQRPPNTSKSLFLVVSRQKFLFLVSFFIDMLKTYKKQLFMKKKFSPPYPPLSQSPPNTPKSPIFTFFEVNHTPQPMPWMTDHSADALSSRKSKFQWKFFYISPLLLPITVNIVIFGTI